MVTLIRQAPRRIALRPRPCCASQTRSYFEEPKILNQKAVTDLQAVKHPIAKGLKDIEAWRPKIKRISKRAMFETGNYKELVGPLEWTTYDAKRVNVVSEELCAHSIERLRPSLEKHQGCDLLDINPGPALWSRHLHDAVKPRQHLLVEGRAKMYGGLIAEQMGDRKHQIIPEAGLNWNELGTIMTKHLDPHHDRIKPGENQKVNNDLLVNVNLTGYPRTKLGAFKDMNRMTIYQMMASIPNSKIFQRYGSVRFFLWINDFNKRYLLPRSATNREAQGVEAEMCCEYVHEVCGYSEMDQASRAKATRDEWMNIESTARAMAKMDAAGMTTPPGRETNYMKQILADPSLREPLVGVRTPKLVRSYEKALAVYEKDAPYEKGCAPIDKRHADLRVRVRMVANHADIYQEMLKVHSKLISMDPSEDGYQEILTKYQHSFDTLKHTLLSDYILLRDNYHLWKHQKDGIPALHWDRRPYEPLDVEPTEFFPNMPLCLIDIQPKPLDPALTQTGQGTSRSRDYAAILLKQILAAKKTPLYPRMLDAVVPGLGGLAKNKCPSFWTPELGGNPLEGLPGLNSRTMAANQFEELTKAWMEWPFRPEYLSFLGKSALTEANPDEDAGAGRRTNFSS